MRRWKYAAAAAQDAPKTVPILFTGDICDCLRNAAAVGFDAIEYHARESTEFDYDVIRKTMEDTGCKISMMSTGRLYTQGGFSLTSEDPQKEKTAVDGILRYIDMAAELGAGIVIGLARGSIKDASSREAYFERLSRNLRLLDAVASEKGVPINIEAINHYETDACMSAMETVAYLNANNFKNCYVHLDTFHMLLEEEDYPKAIRIAGKRLGYFHLADTTRWYPGSGYMDFKTILKTLYEINYNGYLSIECFPHEDAISTAIKGLKYLKTIEETIC